MRRMYFRFLSIYCLATISAAVVLWPVEPVFAEDLRLTYFQGLIGAAKFDDDQLTFAGATQNNQRPDSTNDLSSMPFVGVAGQFPLANTATHLGIDTSLMVGWRSDDTSVIAGNGQARIKIDSNLWLVDAAIGLYAQTILGNRWRLYGAVGPMIIFGEYEDDTAEEDQSATPVAETRESNSDSAFGAGGYAKLGLEYHITGDALIGIAVRGIATNLEFDQAIAGDKLTGIQGFVTFTRAY